MPDPRQPDSAQAPPVEVPLPASHSADNHPNRPTAVPEALLRGKEASQMIRGKGQSRIKIDNTDEGASFLHDKLYQIYDDAGKGEAGATAVKNYLGLLNKTTPSKALDVLGKLIANYGWHPANFNILRWKRVAIPHLIDNIVHYIRKTSGENLPDPVKTWKELGYTPGEPHGSQAKVRLHHINSENQRREQHGLPPMSPEEEQTYLDSIRISKTRVPPTIGKNKTSDGEPVDNGQEKNGNNLPQSPPVYSHSPEHQAALDQIDKINWRELNNDIHAGKQKPGTDHIIQLDKYKAATDASDYNDISDDIIANSLKGGKLRNDPQGVDKMQTILGDAGIPTDAKKLSHLAALYPRLPKNQEPEISKEPEAQKAPETPTQSPEVSGNPPETSREPETPTQPPEAQKAPEVPTQPPEVSKEPETPTQPPEVSKAPEVPKKPDKDDLIVNKATSKSGFGLANKNLTQKIAAAGKDGFTSENKIKTNLYNPAFKYLKEDNAVELVRRLAKDIISGKVDHDKVKEILSSKENNLSYLASSGATTKQSGSAPPLPESESKNGLLHKMKMENYNDYVSSSKKLADHFPNVDVENILNRIANAVENEHPEAKKLGGPLTKKIAEVVDSLTRENSNMGVSKGDTEDLDTVLSSLETPDGVNRYLFLSNVGTLPLYLRKYPQFQQLKPNHDVSDIKQGDTKEANKLLDRINKEKGNLGRKYNAHDLEGDNHDNGENTSDELDGDELDGDDADRRNIDDSDEESDNARKAQREIEGGQKRHDKGLGENTIKIIEKLPLNERTLYYKNLLKNGK